MKPATKAQLSKIHVLLTQLNLLEQKKDMVFQFSNFRSVGSKDLTLNEAKIFIEHLTKFDPCDRMRKKVFALAYQSGIIYGDTPDDRKMNTAKLNLFLKEKGTVKKELSKMNKNELVKVVSQFEQILKHNHYSDAGKETKNLLAELNINTQK